MSVSLRRGKHFSLFGSILGEGGLLQVAAGICFCWLYYMMAFPIRKLMVVHTCSLSTQESEAGGSSRGQCQPKLHKKPLCLKRPQEKQGSKQPSRVTKGIYLLAILSIVVTDCIGLLCFPDCIGLLCLPITKCQRKEKECLA